MICTIWHVLPLTRSVRRPQMEGFTVWIQTHLKPYLDSSRLLGFRLLWQLLQSNHCDWWQQPARWPGRLFLQRSQPMERWRCKCDKRAHLKSWIKSARLSLKQEHLRVKTSFSLRIGSLKPDCFICSQTVDI